MNEDLKNAARKYAIPSYINAKENYLDEYPYDKIAESAFIAGAKWLKEQMMKEAVEYDVWDFSVEACPRVNIPLDNKQYRNGDKVRVIVIPNTDEK